MTQTVSATHLTSAFAPRVVTTSPGDSIASLRVHSSHPCRPHQFALTSVPKTEWHGEIYHISVRGSVVSYTCRSSQGRTTLYLTTLCAEPRRARPLPVVSVHKSALTVIPRVRHRTGCCDLSPADGGRRWRLVDGADCGRLALRCMKLPPLAPCESGVSCNAASGPAATWAVSLRSSCGCDLGAS